jgi:hypothetical protein
VNVTAVEPQSAGFVRVHPCDADPPRTSTLNFAAGQTVANTTIAALNDGGQLCVWTSARTDLLVDVTGWLGPTGTQQFTPIGPERAVDTRVGRGGTRLGPRGVLEVDLAGRVPAGTTAVALNVTSDRAAEPGYLTVYPCGALPDTSTVNHLAGLPRPNNTVVGLSSGRFCIYSFASTDVIVDLTGAFGMSGFRYLPTPPERVLDTRRTRPPIPAGGAVGFSVDAAALGGRQPAAAFVNVTATEHRAPGYVTTYDCGTVPEASTLNQRVGEDVANGANVPLGGLQSCAWMFGGGHLVVDVNGWWVP